MKSNLDNLVDKRGEVVLRPKERQGFVLLLKYLYGRAYLRQLRWCLQLNKDYELSLETAGVFICLGMTRVMVRLLA